MIIYNQLRDAIEKKPLKQNLQTFGMTVISC